MALVGGHTWDEILVNGMVLGEDGFKMSKSRNNIISPEEIVVKYGADALRQWGAGGAGVGSDIMFNWNDVVAASRFQTKMWNIVRFVLTHLDETDRSSPAPATALADRWLLERLSATVAEVTQAMEAYQYDRALKAIREFAWNILADDYIELVKGRLYGEGAGRESACSALYTTMDVLCRMIAPIIPHFAQECYYHLTGGHVHAQAWPDFTVSDETAHRRGDLIVQMVAELRRYKHDAGMALNAPLGSVVIYHPEPINDAGDTGRALNADVIWSTDTPELSQVLSDIDFNMAVIGPAFRKQARAFMDAVRALSEDQIRNPPERIIVGGDEVKVPKDAFAPKFAYRIAGKEVEVLTIGSAIVTIQKVP